VPAGRHVQGVLAWHRTRTGVPGVAFRAAGPALGGHGGGLAGMRGVAAAGRGGAQERADREQGGAFG